MWRDTDLPVAAVDTPSRSVGPHSRLQAGAAGLAVIAVAALYAPTVVWLWERWTLSVWHNAHGALVPPVAMYLAYLELKVLRGRPVTGSASGFLFVVPALLLHVLDTAMHTELVSAVSLVLILPGLSLLFLGVARTRAIAFPLAFMVFALPIPLSLTETLHLALRHVATAATAAIVPLLGIDVFAEGTTLHLARGDLGIADACSGFSTLYAAAAVACLTASQTDGLRRRLLVLASAAPLAIAANILRVVFLVIVVNASGMNVLETWIHPASGLMTFALSLPVIFWLGQSRDASAAGAVRDRVTAGSSTL